MSEAPTYTVTLHHLAAGAKQANAALPDTELPGLSDKKLRELIRALAALTSTNLGAASPELRVVAPHGQFVVKISEGRLRINSWTIKVGGADLSPDQIFSLITGAEAVAEAVGVEVNVGARAGGAKRSRGPLVAVLAVVIIGTNALTAWMLTRPPPPPPMLPEYAPLAKESAERFLTDIAGEYQTGTAEGSRALKITKAGGVHWLLLGPAGAIAEDTEVVAQPVQTHGQPALLADGRALIEPINAVAVSFYSETYRKKGP